MAKEEHNPITEAERFNPRADVGLNNFQVEQRKEEGLVNKTKLVIGKSYFEIIRTDAFSFFDIILYVVAGLMIWGAQDPMDYLSLLFLVILVVNIVIALYQDIRSRHLVSKLKHLNPEHTHVMREGRVEEIDSSEVVLDDILVLKAGDQVPCDGTLIDGNCEIDASAISGESEPVYAVPGDEILSGCIIVSGTCHVKVEKVGKYSYIESVRLKANAAKRKPSEIIKSFNKLYLVVGIITIVIAGFYLLVMGLQGILTTQGGFREQVLSFGAALVSMIPVGLYLLTSLSLATGAVALIRRRVLVQDIYSLEMLARVDVFCVDKTGTITDGDMKIKNLIPFGGNNKEELKHIISNILNATGDTNDTAEALRNEFYYPLTSKVMYSLPFNSVNKYSGATFERNKTYFIGAPEFLNITDRPRILKYISEYTNKGFRVLLVAKGNTPLSKKVNTAQGKLEAMGAIILEDHVRESALATFKQLTDSGVAIKVISGDNERTVSQVAIEAGIPNADLAISLEGISDEAEIKKLADKYVVFGRVNPEQKRILVEALHEAGHTVGMTGDGVNDILALKRADCSIAMHSGSQAAQNVSHLVLLDSDFNRLPDILYEGRRTINNIQRTGSLFLIKTIFAMFFTILFLSLSLAYNNPEIRYPFFTNNLYVWEFVGIGVTGFFIALEGNKEKIEPGFMSNIFRKAIPGAIVMILAVGSVFLYDVFIRDGTYDPDLARTMSTIVMSVLGVIILMITCMPWSKYRGVVCTTAFIIGVLAMALAPTLNMEEFFRMDYSLMGGVEYFVIVLVIITFALLYLLSTIIIKRGRPKRPKKEPEQLTT